MPKIEIKPPFMDTPWFEDDPRYHVNKRADIVIVFGTGKFHKQSIVAEVETKNGWGIYFNRHGREKDLPLCINEVEDWPEGWFWTYVPRRGK